MRLLPLFLACSLLLTSCAGARLSREEAQKAIAELGTSRLIPEAVEIRHVDSVSENFAVVECTVTLAFQFTRTGKDGEWQVSAIRFGDRDWVNMSEVLAAISGGAGPKPPPGANPSTYAAQVANNLSQLFPRARDISELGQERKDLTEIGESKLVPPAITVRRIVEQTANQAIAESTVTLSFQFKRNGLGGNWYVVGVRLGQHDWIDVNQMLAAINAGRRRDTTASLNKLVAGIEAYRKKQGSLPTAHDIVELTDILHPDYMGELVRLDAWGHPISYSATGSTFRLTSSRADGILGTPDDITVSGNAG